MRFLRSFTALQYFPFNSYRSFSSMNASNIVLPHEEIDKLLFGGLDFQKGQPPPMNAVMRWFRPNTEFDDTCGYQPPSLTIAFRKYKSLVDQIIKLPFEDVVALAKTPGESLTLILLLDQLVRNFSRKSPFAFTSCDPVAVKVVEHFVNQKHDIAHPPYKRFWYYVPFMHAESIPYQEYGVAKFANACWELREGEWTSYHD